MNSSRDLVAPTRHQLFSEAGPISSFALREHSAAQRTTFTNCHRRSWGIVSLVLAGFTWVASCSGAACVDRDAAEDGTIRITVGGVTQVARQPDLVVIDVSCDSCQPIRVDIGVNMNGHKTNGLVWLGHGSRSLVNVWRQSRLGLGKPMHRSRRYRLGHGHAHFRRSDTSWTGNRGSHRDKRKYL
jgi:hypothetical protein